MDFQNANEIFDVYARYPHQGKMQGYSIGRFMVQDGKLRILEDHTGQLKESLTNGPVGHSAAQLQAMVKSPYIKVIAESEVAKGHHVDLIPKGKDPNPLGPQPQDPPDVVETPDLGEAPQSFHVGEGDSFSMTTPPAVFDYISTGMREPQVLEVKGEDVYMNGKKLDRPEVERILYTIHTGIGKIKYRKAI